MKRKGGVMKRKGGVMKLKGGVMKRKGAPWGQWIYWPSLLLQCDNRSCKIFFFAQKATYI